MSKYFVFGLLAISLMFSVVIAPHAQAHVLIVDELQSTGAIVHVNPDDSPIAGQATTIFFDIQSSTLESSAARVVVSVVDDRGKPIEADSRIRGRYVTVTSQLPYQGVYRVQLEVSTAEGAQYIFTHTQRVSRGVIEGGVDTLAERHRWAEILLVMSGVGLLAVGIIGLNRRRAIAAHSQ